MELFIVLGVLIALALAGPRFGRDTRSWGDWRERADGDPRWPSRVGSCDAL